MQEYHILPPTLEDDLPHVPALFIGPGFDAEVAASVNALALRQITTLNVNSEGMQDSDRKAVFCDALGALLLEDPFPALSSIALHPKGAADLFGQIEDDGVLREFPHYVLPLSCSRKLDLPATVRRSLDVCYVPAAPPGCSDATLLKQYAAVGEALSIYDRKVYKNEYRQRSASARRAGKLLG